MYASVLETYHRSVCGAMPRSVFPPLICGGRTKNTRSWKERAQDTFSGDELDDMVAAENEESDDGEGGDEGENEGDDRGGEPCGTTGAGVGPGGGVGLGVVILGLGGLGSALNGDGMVVSGGSPDIVLLTAMGGAVGCGGTQRVLRASGVWGRPDGCGGALGDCLCLGGMVIGGCRGRGKGGAIHGLSGCRLLVRL